MKYLLVLVVVLVGIWMLMRSIGRARDDAPPGRQGPKRPADKAPPKMLACAHCGVHLPADEAVLDAARRPYCGDEHRLAGPR